jgi:L-alanine-DL-glutamate epimerase-like enolase superfamily enzyme
MLNWTIEKHNLYLKFNFAISRGSATTKTNFYIRLDAHGCVGQGEVAPNERYQETPEKVLSEFAILLNNELPIIKNLDKLQTLLETYKISACLRNGIENAYIAWHCQKEKKTLQQYFDLPKSNGVSTAFTIPILPVEQMANFHLRHNLSQFSILKLKVEKNTALEAIAEIDRISDKPIIIDANESWSDVDEFIHFMSQLESYNILFIEQPLPAHKVDEYIFLKSRSPYPIWADESLTQKTDISTLKKQFHGINIKLMKSGGLSTAYKQLKQAKLYGLKTMIGCMVETSLGISQAMCLAPMADYVDLDSFLYLEEDPAKLLLTEQGKLFLIDKD